MIFDRAGNLKESFTPPHGVLLADHFLVEYGYYGHRPAGSRDWLILYTLGGEGAIKLEKDVLRVRTRDVVLYPPGTPHNYAATEAGTWDFMWAHFVPEPHWSEWLRLPMTGGVFVHSLQEDAFERGRQAFRRLIVDSKGRGKSHLELAMISLSEILVLLHLDAVERSEQDADERVGEILHYMSRHLHEPMDSRKLARHIGLSVSRLCHLFKEQTGATITDTLLTLRLQKSAQLLEFTTRQIAEVALDVGFNSPFYFTRKFKEYYKLTPTEYRRQATENRSAP